MVQVIEAVNIAQLPRKPFLVHSSRLVRYLQERCSIVGNDVLELGCGRQSPLVPVLNELWPSAKLHQVDARKGVLAEAAAHNPNGVVEHMFATDMATIPDESKDVVVAMSFFDQNLDSAIAQIGREIHRILRPGGFTLYIHNEQLNLPATAMSARYQTLTPPTERAHPEYMVPSDLWQPTNDLEYCNASVATIDAAVARLGTSSLYVQRYLRRMYPDLDRLHAPSAVASQMSLEEMGHIRQTVALIRRTSKVAFKEQSTAERLAGRIEPVLGGEGFKAVCAGTFEIRKCVSWESLFLRKPMDSTFVRGLSAYGYSSGQSPDPIAEYRQDLHTPVSRGKDQIELVAYQYGFVGQKK